MTQPDFDFCPTKRRIALDPMSTEAILIGLFLIMSSIAFMFFLRVKSFLLKTIHLQACEPPRGHGPVRSNGFVPAPTSTQTEQLHPYFAPVVEKPTLVWIMIVIPFELVGRSFVLVKSANEAAGGNKSS